MELLLIRHGLPVRRELTEGIADPELAPDGLAQAALLGEYLASEHLDAVYASSLKRAQQTAEPVVEGRDLAMRIEPDVAEFDKDSSEYVPVEELKANNDPRWQAMLNGTMEGWEDHEAFTTRSIAGVNRIIDAHRGHRVAIVCHGGVINAYLSHVLDFDPGRRGFFYPNYTSIHRIAAASSGERTILTVNETTHLRGSGLPMGLFQKG
jgi:probable phosphoglycerate mutase